MWLLISQLVSCLATEKNNIPNTGWKHSPSPCLLWGCRLCGGLQESWNLQTKQVGRAQPLQSCSQTPGCSPSGGCWTSPCPQHTPGGLGIPDSFRGTTAAAAAICPKITKVTPFLYWGFWDVLSFLLTFLLRSNFFLYDYSIFVASIARVE